MQFETTPPSEAAAERVRARRRALWTAFPPMLLGALLAIVGEAMPPAWAARETGWFGWALVVVGFALLAVHSRRTLRSSSAILWIRKFPTEPPPIPGRSRNPSDTVRDWWQRRREVRRQRKQIRRLQTQLEFSALGIGHVVTLADPLALTRDAEARRRMSWQGFTIIAALGATAAASEQIDWQGAVVVTVLMWAQSVAPSILSRSESLTWSNYRARISARLRGIRGDRAGRPSTTFKCPAQGRLWERAIDQLAPRIQAVVITADQQIDSRALNMEIEKLLHHVDARSFVIIRSVSDAPDTLTIRPELAEARMVFLPHVSWWPFGRAWQDIAGLLDDAIQYHCARSETAVTSMPLVTLTGPNYAYQSLRRKRFDPAVSLAGAAFIGADVSSADFRHCDLQGSSFEGALMLATRFDHANLAGADFTGSHSGRRAAPRRLLATSSAIAAALAFLLLTVVAMSTVSTGQRRLSEASPLTWASDAANFLVPMAMLAILPWGPGKRLIPALAILGVAMVTALTATPGGAVFISALLAGISLLWTVTELSSLGACVAIVATSVLLIGLGGMGTFLSQGVTAWGVVASTAAAAAVSLLLLRRSRVSRMGVIAGTSFHRANLAQTIWRRATVHCTDFSDANLAGIDWSTANLKGSLFASVTPAVIMRHSSAWRRLQHSIGRWAARAGFRISCLVGVYSLLPASFRRLRRRRNRRAN